MFTFTVTGTGKQMFGLTTDPNLANGTGLVPVHHLSYGIFNYNNILWVFNNNSLGEPADNMRTASSTTQIRVPGPDNPPFGTTGMFPVGVNTYTMIYDGTFITHYINSKQYLPSLKASFTVPHYVLANSHAGIVGPITIKFNNIISGPTGNTGPTGVAALPVKYQTQNAILDSFGNFNFTGAGGVSILATTPISGAFSISLIVTTAISPCIVTFGIATSWGALVPSHGIEHTTPLPAGGKTKVFINGSFTPVTNFSGDIINIDLTRVGQTIQIVFDGITTIQYFIDGTLRGQTINTQTPLSHIQFKATGTATGGVSINYQPMALSRTGATGPGGPPGTGPTGPTRDLAVWRFYSGLLNTTNNLNFISGDFSKPSGGFLLNLVEPFTGGGLRNNAIILDTSLSSVTKSNLTIALNTNLFINNNSFSLLITISSAIKGSMALQNIFYMYVKVSNGLTSSTQDHLSFNYTFILRPTQNFQIFIGPLKTTNYNSTQFNIIITENLAAAGGGPTIGGGPATVPRIVDVVPSLKPKFRKSSIRVKKAKKQSKKQMRK
jgi:hypothetical protein